MQCLLCLEQITWSTEEDQLVPWVDIQADEYKYAFAWIKEIRNRQTALQTNYLQDETYPQNSQKKTHSRLFINYDVGKRSIALFRDLTWDQISKKKA